MYRILEDIKNHMPTFFLAIAVSALLIAAGTFYVFFLRGPQTGLPGGTLTIGGKTFSVEIAETIAARAQGLSGRDLLPENHGMLFIFSSPGNSGFWMKDMKFALDFVWIRGGNVVGVTENVPPPAPGTRFWSLPVYYPLESADQILEVDAGTVAREGIKAGDVVALSR